MATRFCREGTRRALRIQKDIAKALPLTGRNRIGKTNFATFGYSDGSFGHSRFGDQALSCPGALNWVRSLSSSELLHCQSG
jgi:hypothetical protein